MNVCHFRNGDDHEKQKDMSLMTTMVLLYHQSLAPNGLSK
jgi:hypothetical protein